MAIEYEFYETPGAYTRWLLREVPIVGTCFEPCSGSGAIIRDSGDDPNRRFWLRNDLDTRWAADFHHDATCSEPWIRATAYFQDTGHDGIDWTVTNPPFGPAIPIIQAALEYSRIGVAMHLRASIHEVLKTGIRRTFLAQHPPTGILWLPRFAYQRSKTTGKWATDSVTACWCVWMKDPAIPQFVRYAPELVINELQAEESEYRIRMDSLMAHLNNPELVSEPFVEAPSGR